MAWETNISNSRVCLSLTVPSFAFSFVGGVGSSHPSRYCFHSFPHYLVPAFLAVVCSVWAHTDLVVRTHTSPGQPLPG